MLGWAAGAVAAIVLLAFAATIPTTVAAFDFLPTPPAVPQPITSPMAGKGESESSDIREE